MLGQAMVALGASTTPGEALVEDGLRAELAEVAHPDGGGFELLSLSEAYLWNEEHLANDPAWQAAQPALADYLSGHGAVISDAGVCYTTSTCYDNLKLVAAVADLALLRTGLGGLNAASLLAEPSALEGLALTDLAAAADNTGVDAVREGAVSYSGAGILSDPTENPLAYHALSTLMLGHAVAALGGRAPASLSRAFDRAARALVGLIAPDGDVAYIGRGQGQVWTVAATVDALSLAAASSPDATWRGRYLAGAQLALHRLEAVYPRSGWGLPVVPRLAHVARPRSYVGVDGYANSVEYNGLAVWALRDAAAVLARIPQTQAGAVPSQTEGAFLDPSHARFATVTHGRLWFAVHGTDSNLSDDRYGFGLVAAERVGSAGWKPVLPARPLTSRPQVGGMAMRAGGRTLYPTGTDMSVTPGGAVHVSGRWRAAGGRPGPDASWLFRPSGEGVELAFEAPPGAAFQFQIWFEEGALVRIRHNGVHVREPGGLVQSYYFNAPVTVHADGIAHSAYVTDLPSAVITLPASSRHAESPIRRRSERYATALRAGAVSRWRATRRRGSRRRSRPPRSVCARRAHPLLQAPAPWRRPCRSCRRRSRRRVPSACRPAP